MSIEKNFKKFKNQKNFHAVFEDCLNLVVYRNRWKRSARELIIVGLSDTHHLTVRHKDEGRKKEAKCKDYYNNAGTA